MAKAKFLKAYNHNGTFYRAGNEADITVGLSDLIGAGIVTLVLQEEVGHTNPPVKEPEANVPFVEKPLTAVAPKGTTKKGKSK